MSETYRQRIRRTQNESLQRKTSRGRYHVDYPHSFFVAPQIPGAPLISGEGKRVIERWVKDNFVTQEPEKPGLTQEPEKQP
jgi:hypothetical protein